MEIDGYSIPTQPFIGGDFVAGKEKIAVKNPWDGKDIAEVALAGASEMEQALDCAVTGHEALAKLKPFERAEILFRISDGIRKEQDKLSLLITKEVGKPISLSRAEVGRAANTFKIASEEARRLEGRMDFQEGYTPTGGTYAFSRRFPVSVMLAITPFNFPLNLAAHKIAPAFAVGTAVIHKPSRYCPLTALALARICREAGIPNGALNTIPSSPETLDYLIGSERVKKISFTGSAEVGWALKEKCGKKKVTLELGGNAACVIEEVDNIAEVAKRVAKASFAYAGQICISVQRVLVNEKIFEEFLDSLVSFTREGIKSGDPMDEEVLNGPMISKGDLQRIGQWVEEALAQGARLHTGGHAEGFVYLPTILTDLLDTAKVWCEEAFAPVVCVRPYKDFEEAVAQVNNSRFGLQAGYYLRDADKIFYAYERTEVGAVLINEVPTARIDELAYGGVKDSGFGREGVRNAMEEMTEERMLVMKPGV